VNVFRTGDGCGVGIGVGTGDGIYERKQSMKMHVVTTTKSTASVKNEV
jgi:hypothetical protein